MRPTLARVAASPFEAVAAVVAVISGALTLLTQLTASRAVEIAASPVGAEVWALMMVLGGAMVITGIVSGRVAVEAAGLIFLAGSLTVYTISVVIVHGWGVLVRSYTQLAVIAGCLIRTWVLARGENAVLLPRGIRVTDERHKDWT